MATKDRKHLLQTVSLPSVARQLRPPDLFVLVADGCHFTTQESQEIAELIAPAELIVLNNSRKSGAAGAWNTGLDYLNTAKFEGFVAILDDDDEWDSDHLSTCLSAATQTQASVVVSGLRFMRDGIAQERDLPRDYRNRMFLSGNPGWQGSNTFVAMTTFISVGGFRDGMASCNDRDLAIRLLRFPDIQVAYTGKWTATWRLTSDHPALSAPRSKTKLSGLQWFWLIYGSEMEPPEAEEFFARASALFRIERDEIILATTERPPHCKPRGDLLS